MPLLITFAEGATRAGISVRTADRLTERNEFVAIYALPGGHRRVDAYDIDEWVKSRRIDNKPEEEANDDPR